MLLTVGTSALIPMMLSREADRREDILFKQGRGQFHVSSSGHETLALFAPYIEKEDHLYCHYRDRALLLALGVPLYQAALGFFARAESSSGGRQLVNHFCYKPLNIISGATPCALQCLPATGAAWAFKMQEKKNISFCFVGDASTRQGEFFEAVAFAIQEQLPVIFVVEDNGYGISTPTENMSPVHLGLMPEKYLCQIDGRNVETMDSNIGRIIADVRSGKGPKVLWLSLDRLTPHTASDDHTKYRSQQELEEISLRDPVLVEKQRLINDQLLLEDDLSQLEKDIELYVKQSYARAEAAALPDPEDVTDDIISDFKETRNIQKRIPFSPYPQDTWTMAEAWNHALNEILKNNEKALVFGEDVADPKGGVFGLTKGLSSGYQGRVINSPLAEATIAGLASGLSISGYLPIFELQFADFIGPAFNQIVNQIATLRWRSKGQYKCPLILYAPCGSYIANGGPWHSQTNESWFAHAPGLKVFMPSTPDDAANILIDAASGEDPVLILLPKNLFFVRAPNNTKDCLPIYSERAKIKRSGEHITIVSWGNCVGFALEAARRLDQERISCEVIDLCAITPCDWQAVHESVRKTGRLIVVQEDNKTCSFGQSIMSEICSDFETWESLYSSPQLVSRPDIHIGFNPVLEQAVLPNVDDIIMAARLVTGTEDPHVQNR
ncbi:MAG: transketolase [Rhodospirillales bacterium]|nr:transketolase [Rhodospirillales bacterium]MCB9994888.1 transketolase [Rhodospirillales bacterium]